MPRQRKTPTQITHAKEVGDRIKRARTRRRIHSDFEPMTREELAEKANIPYATIGCYERGEISPGSEPLKRLAQALRVKVSWLLYGST